MMSKRLAKLWLVLCGLVVLALLGYAAWLYPALVPDLLIPMLIAVSISGITWLTVWAFHILFDCSDHAGMR